MNNLYKFSPIENEPALQEVWNYLTTQLEKLSIEVVGEALPINTLKVFPHYPYEYDYLYQLILSKGPKAAFSSEKNLYVEVKMNVQDYLIEYLGVRVTDPNKPQVGCGDYEIDYFDQFKSERLNTSPYLREVREDMIEIWHPDYDVLGYVVPPFEV